MITYRIGKNALLGSTLMTLGFGVIMWEKRSSLTAGFITLGLVFHYCHSIL